MSSLISRVQCSDVARKKEALAPAPDTEPPAPASDRVQRELEMRGGTATWKHLTTPGAAVASKAPEVGFLAEVAEAPWSGAEWAVALRFDNPRATVLVLLLSDTPLGVLGFQTP